MKNEEEKLEFKKKPQEVKKEDLDKVGGGGVTCANSQRKGSSSGCFCQ